MPDTDSGTTTDTQSREDLLRQMSFLEHLEELRKRLIYSVLSVVVGFFACYAFAEKIYGLMQAPILTALRNHHMSDSLVYLSPTEPFNLYIKISFLAGVFLPARSSSIKFGCSFRPAFTAMRSATSFPS